MKSKEKKQWKLRNKETKERGITLIALVVTIIILLILAGVAINLSIGDNGLFRKAQEAVNTYKVAEQKESEDLKVLENELEKAKVDWSKVYDSTGYTPKTTPIKTKEGTYYIPEGFKLASDSAGKISDGIVVEDVKGNQFVWIPCYVEGGVGAEIEGAIKYDRYVFEGQVYDDNDSLKIYPNSTDKTYYYSETLVAEEEASVREYGGYFIGRYEAGDGIVTNADTPRLRIEGDNQTNTVTIKKGQAPYVWITLENIKTLSNNFGVVNNYNESEMYTKLISSYAWDTAIKYIEKEHATYGSTSQDKNRNVVGNYKDHTFNYKDISGSEQTKSSRIIIPTGQTTPVKNIYDMGGNTWEVTSESVSDPGPKYVMRGGTYYYDSSYCSAGHRNYRGVNANPGVTFRLTLFLK